MEGRELKIIYETPFSTATSAMVFASLNSASRLPGPERGGFVMAKIVCAPVRAFSREGRCRVSAWMTSMFLDARVCDLEEVVSRVRARRVYWWEREGSARMKFMIEVPWLPVAPKMARVFDIVYFLGER